MWVEYSQNLFSSILNDHPLVGNQFAHLAQALDWGGLVGCSGNAGHFDDRGSLRGLDPRLAEHLGSCHRVVPAFEADEGHGGRVLANMGDRGTP